MSPVKRFQSGEPDRFPRVSGDEPAARASRITDLKFSPRERG